MSSAAAPRHRSPTRVRRDRASSATLRITWLFVSEHEQCRRRHRDVGRRFSLASFACPPSPRSRRGRSSEAVDDPRVEVHHADAVALSADDVEFLPSGEAPSASGSAFCRLAEVSVQLSASPPVAGDSRHGARSGEALDGPGADQVPTSSARLAGGRGRCAGRRVRRVGREQVAVRQAHDAGERV